MARKVAKPVEPETPPPPKYNEVIIHDKEDGIENLRVGAAPSYLLAGDGLFLVRKTLLGTGMIKQRRYMDWLKVTGIKGEGNFEYDAPILPANLTAQIQDFFATVFERQHTEAAVLLIMHEETREWRVFVPTQLVSHGGVNYVYDRSHISRGWLVAGSIHSHCDFSASHSGTDTGDAEGFEGVHFTFGHNNRHKEVDGKLVRDPSRVCMVYQNKTRFDYDPETMADFSELGQHPAPDWWYQYVGPPLAADDRKPVGFELFAKFKQDTTIKEEKKVVDPKLTTLHQVRADGTTSLVPWGGGASRPYATQRPSLVTEHTIEEMAAKWRAEDEEIDRHWEDWTGTQNRAWLRANGWEYNDRTGQWTGPADRLEHAFYSEAGVTNESRAFNARQRANHADVQWNEEGGLEIASSDTREYRPERPQPIVGLHIADYWEDMMPDGFLDALMDTDMVTDDDIDWAIENINESTLPAAWAERLISKIAKASALISQYSNYGISIKNDKQKGKHPS